MSKRLMDKWNHIYTTKIFDRTPATVLSKHLFLLPEQGKALDLASGYGANALLLAKQGLTTEAWDISDIAMEKLQAEAKVKTIVIKTLTQEITVDSLLVNRFDVIVVSRFLDRSICNAIMGALKSGGLLFYQTYTQQKTSRQGPKNPQFLLKKNELLCLFSELQLVYYQENSDVGRVQLGLRNEAQFIGQKK